MNRESVRAIRPTLTKELEAHVNGARVARANPFPIATFRDLVEQVAHLSYLNKDHLLFFRGQGRDFLNKANSSTVYPSIYRGERVPREQLDLSFSLLESASSRLCQALSNEGLDSYRDVRRRRYIQWSVLQHYEVCPTPLLDLTQSLRVACSFAFLSVRRSAPCVFVFGLPYVTNRISINSEHDLVNVRLLSICPPEALRPYFQEGYLAGTDEVLLDFDSKSELDFSNRLVAKFHLLGDESDFWKSGFQPYPRKVLYPSNDRMKDLCEDLRNELGTGVTAGRVGAFLEQWTALESHVVKTARSLSMEKQVHSMKSAVDALRTRTATNPQIIERLHRLRAARNNVVHQPERANAARVATATEEARTLLRELDVAIP